MRIFGTSYAQYDEKIMKQYDLGVEVGHFMVATGLDRYEEIKEEVAAYPKAFPHISMHGACHDTKYTSMDPLIVAVVKKRFLQCVTIAETHKIPKIVFHSTNTPYDNRNTSTKTAWLDKSEAFWQEFIPLVPKGIQIYLENMEENEPECFLELIERVAPYGISCCFDIGHAYSHSKVPLDRWIDLLVPHIRHVHLHDNDGTFDQHLPLGRGTLPLTEVLSQMIPRLPEDTPFVLECDLLESLQWLSDHGFAPPDPVE